MPQAQQEVAEMAALNERERRELDMSPPPPGASDDDEGVPALPVARAISMLNSCRDVHAYQKLHMISQGTYGIVYMYVPYLWPQGCGAFQPRSS